MTKLQLAKLRQKVRSLKTRRNTLEHVAMSHHPMVGASFIERHFKTGQTAYFLSIPTPENVAWHRYIRKDELDYFRRRAGAWREFVHAMAEWVTVNKEIEQSLRQLGKGRCEKLEVRRGKDSLALKRSRKA